MDIQEDIQARIASQLQELATKEDIVILYACESGSRAWGFPSPDSDYDVRFIYLRPLEWYLEIDPRSDTIDLPIDSLLDINGWDLRKALKLFKGSNSVIYEWLQSPIIYQNHRRIDRELLDLAPSYYAPRAGIHHYLNLTSSCYQEHLQSDLVKLKKYFYALRPILAARWIIEQGTYPPMVFDRLLELIVDRQDLRLEIDRLLTIKATANESTTIPVSPMLNNFITAEIENCRQAVKLIPNPNIDDSVLNKIFQKYALNST
jgi:uncharacterized protein